MESTFYAREHSLRYRDDAQDDGGDMQLLHVIASPRTKRSASRQGAHAFIEAWKAKHPDATVDELNVWDNDLPVFDGPILEAKYAGIEGRELEPAQADAWRIVHTLAERFRQAN